MASEYSHILREAADIADERELSYGAATDHFEEVSKVALLMFNIKVTPVEIVQVLLAMKAVRERYKHKDDNIIDTINYNAILLKLLAKQHRS